MPVRIRLQRHGRKGYPFYHIVVADSRSPRDGKYIERLGIYNPNTNPATIDLDTDKAVDWIFKGAQPSDTAAAILRYKGAMYKKHLAVGVKKGALTQEDADKKFAAWLQEKEAKVQAKVDKLANESAADRKARLEAEAKINKDRADAIAKKRSDLAAELEASAKAAAAEAAGEEPAEEEEIEAAAEEAPAAEAPAEEAPATEAPAAEAKDEEKKQD